MLFRQMSRVVHTRSRGMIELTPELHQFMRKAEIDSGLCTVFLHHTSASLILCENADPSVRRDLEHYFARLVRDGDPEFEHMLEGDDDMPAHIRTILTQNSLTIPVAGGTLDLGTWQGVYLWEHRVRPHSRRITISVIGTARTD